MIETIRESLWILIFVPLPVFLILSIINIVIAIKRKNRARSLLWSSVGYVLGFLAMQFYLGSAGYGMPAVAGPDGVTGANIFLVLIYPFNYTFILISLPIGLLIDLSIYLRKKWKKNREKILARLPFKVTKFRVIVVLFILALLFAELFVHRIIINKYYKPFKEIERSFSVEMINNSTKTKNTHFGIEFSVPDNCKLNSEFRRIFYKSNRKWAGILECEKNQSAYIEIMDDNKEKYRKFYKSYKLFNDNKRTYARILYGNIIQFWTVDGFNNQFLFIDLYNINYEDEESVVESFKEIDF